MFSSRVSDNLAFVSRQLSSLLKKNDVETAFKRLSEESGPHYQADIESLKALLTDSATAAPALGPNPYRTLASMMTEVQGSKDKLFRKFVDFVQQNKVVFETYWTGVVGLMFYLAALSAQAVAISVIFGIYVLPSFSTMFSGFGTALPDFTRQVFAYGAAGVPVVIIVLVVIVGLSAWFVTMFHRRIQRFEPLPRWPTWVPLASKISTTYNFGLFVNFANMLVQCGVPAARAINFASAHTNQPPEIDHDKMIDSGTPFGDMPAFEELAIAARLGHIDSELDHQCEQHLARLSTALVETRERFSIVLKIVFYFFIAALIVAMYLPIFKMGTVI